MGTDRIEGHSSSLPPASKGATQPGKSFREAIEKIEKISEVDPDEPSRRQPYSPLEAQKRNSQKQGAVNQQLPLPGPASPDFFWNTAPKNTSSGIPAGTVPTSSAPPEEKDSPQAAEFWESFEAESFEEPSHRRFEDAAEDEALEKEKKIRAIEEEESETHAKKGKKHPGRSDRSPQAAPFAAPVVLEAESLAKTATLQAAPHLNAETLLLFEKMVSSFFILLSTPGVLQMEVLLNSPMFAQSLFYGSTITIKRYAAAANAMNIEFSGPEEAVCVFQENIPSLQTAFQNGQFAFTVNRIEAVYGTPRKVRRKKGSTQ